MLADFYIFMLYKSFRTPKLGGHILYRSFVPFKNKCHRNLASYKFIPGNRNGHLKGNCSMLKMTVNEDIKTGSSSRSTTITIYGRTDLVCPKTGMVTHANWRRDLSLTPFWDVPTFGPQI